MRSAGVKRIHQYPFLYMETEKFKREIALFSDKKKNISVKNKKSRQSTVEYTKSTNTKTKPAVIVCSPVLLCSNLRIKIFLLNSILKSIHCRNNTMLPLMRS